MQHEYHRCFAQAYLTCFTVGAAEVPAFAGVAACGAGAAVETEGEAVGAGELGAALTRHRVHDVAVVTGTLSS